LEKAQISFWLDIEHTDKIFWPVFKLEWPSIARSALPLLIFVFVKNEFHEKRIIDFLIGFFGGNLLGNVLAVYRLTLLWNRMKGYLNWEKIKNY
jgi:hypothetical protein